MNNTNFYAELDFKYPEIAICLENCVGEGKFFIPVITPLLPKNNAYDELNINLNKKNILNNTPNMEIKKCIHSNYIKLNIPGNGIGKKGDEFIIIFIGGDLNKPKIISSPNSNNFSLENTYPIGYIYYSTKEIDLENTIPNTKWKYLGISKFIYKDDNEKELDLYVYERIE